MRFFSVSARKRTRGEQRMLILIARLLILTCYLPVSNGVDEKKQEAAVCSNNACYTVHLSKVKFSEANLDCTNRGGNLVTIMDENEAELVHTLILQLTKNTLLNIPLKLWIGLKLKQCVIQHELLKGFSWTTGDENTAKSTFSNWLSQPKKTCAKEMCVSMKLHADPLKNFKWVDSLCSSVFDGYICKFDFQGMCQPLVLAGPGNVEYETPFSVKGSSFNLLPYASFGFVSCTHNQHITLICKEMKESGTTVYQWVDPRTSAHPGALCLSKEFGCNFNNGGCEHKCTENSETGSISCECDEGYVLTPNLVSCVLRNHCESHQCEHNCVNQLYGHKCTCSSGFVLAENQRNCTDIDECLDGPCNHTCINTVGSFLCHCPEGLFWHGTQCLDIDECIASTCSQGCLNTYGSYLCSCNNGYVLDSDKKSCLDVDECINSPCAQACENTPGSYTCTCPLGFKLSLDRISCIPELHSADITPTVHGDKDLEQKKDTTSNSQRDITHQPTQSSVFQPPFTETKDEIQKALSSPGYSEIGSSFSNSTVDHVIKEPQDGYSIVLLISILCACGVVLVLLTVAGGFLCYRRRNAKQKETKKQSSATDKYCWVPDSETKTNEFR